MEGWTVIDCGLKLTVLRVEECRALVRRGAAYRSISIEYHVTYGYCHMGFSMSAYMDTLLG
jgi:hypothetical protein